MYVMKIQIPIIMSLLLILILEK